MNKNAYRTLFSHASGTFIAVAENTRNRGKGATGGNTPANDSFPLMRFALLSVLVAAAFGQVTTVHAQMIAYKNGGPAPIIDRAGNGVPVVQIVQPNGSGLSHNRYTDFNVDRNGVILNNSPTSVNTTLSGYIQGNAQINTSANVILNETMGVAPSHLNGYIEVAGQRADVIIANPNGLSVNGFGVINGGNVTLTTGVAQFGGDGSLAAYRVTRGQIAVDGDGINALQNDSLSLISRSVAFNAQLQARNLGFVTGANSVTPDMTGIEVIQGDGEQPTVAIDSSALGGLYAQKIKLVGTEAGVGVRTYGDMASSGDFVLDAAGKVSLNGKTHAGGQMTIRSNDDIDNTGTLYAQRASINSTGQVVNSGTMASQSDLSVVANSINSTGILAAGIDANGQATQAGNLVLNANGQLTATGQNTAGNNVTMTGASVNLTGAHTSANGATTLTATNGDILHAGGNIQAAGGTVLQATGTVVNDHGVINTSSFNSTSGAFSNISGSVTQSGTSDTNIITSGITNNTSGVIATNANNSNLQSASFMNDAGVVTQAGGGALTINSGAISNVNGRIATNGALLLTGTSLNNSRGSLIANRDAMLKLSGDLRNTQGTLQAANALTASAATIDNTAGRITSLDASGLSLDASGVLRNIAGTTADGAQGGVIGGNGDVALTAANAINSGSITAGNNLSAHIGNQLNNDGGRLAAANTLALQAALLNNAQGTLDAAKINATIAQLNNNNGKINADQLTLHATNLSNQGGHIAQFGKDASIIDVTDTLDNANGGVIQTNSTDLTLTPRQLNNNGGTISLAGQGALTIDVGESALQNAGGTIGSNGATQVHAGSVHNAGGSVFGAGATTITARNGDIDNSNSGYLGGDSLALQAFAQFNNVSGKAEAMKNGFTVHANSLNNAGGTIQNLGTSALTIALQQGLNNSAADGVGGFIGSAGSAAIHAADIGNADGTIYTKDDLLLNADNVLNNNAGVIQSDNALVAHAGQAILNQNGRIEANGAGATLTLSGASIDNSAGRIANSGSGATTINSAGNIANDAGTISGNGNVTLAANYLTNTQGHVISANDLTLAIANSINNAQGSLYAARHLKANHANATFNNNAGKVSAGGDIALTLASLDNTNGQIGNTAGDGGNIALSTSGNVTNAAGNIGSDNNTTINANTIIGEGKVIAGQDATINLQGDYTNTVGNTFTANRDLHVSTTGTLTNAGNLEAVRHLGLSAANVTNQYGALINAGNGNTVIRASNAVYNLGRIYGDDVAIGAQTMTNDGILNSDGSTYQAGVIAARNDLTIGAHTILNREHATLQSLNNMVLGGALDVENKAIGNAASIINASATIDAGNDLTFQTATLTNQNNHFTTHLVIDPAQTRRVTQYRAYGSDIWYNADQITWSDSGDGGIVLVLPDGNRFEKFYKQDYTQIVQKTTVTSSDPGNITAGRHMTLSGDVTNDKSTIIAGGTLGGQVGNITNLGAPGEITTTNQMTAGHNYYHWVDGHPHQNHYIYDNNGEAYDVNLPSQQFTLPVWTVLDLTKPNQGDNGAVGTGVDNNTVPAGDNSTIGGNQGGHDLVGDGQTVGAADGAAGGNTGTSGTPQTVGKPGVPVPNISIGNNQLFPIVQNPHSPFLVETDPKFTNYKNFISSDYLLGRLGIDPMTTQKRLGDGFYEQKLINDQITELTGKRFLGTFATNEEQYQALMGSGVASAEQFQLTPGIALTAAQMAALTTDIVWLVSQNVALPDGSTQSVLVPVVYLARVDASDVSPTGAVMSGRNIDLSINGTLDNGGTLQASNNTLIHATDIHNTGTLRSDAKTGTTMLVADNDLINNGGSIAGNRVGILAGRDVSMESITSSASSKNGVNVGISKVASVSADQLSIQSGRDINLKVTAITTTGDAAMIAGRDINLSTVTTQATSNVTYGDQNHLNESQTQVHGTQINAGGNLTLAAGQDINAQASTLHADAALTAAAGRDVNIVAAAQTTTKDQEIYTSSSGFMSSSSSHMQDQQRTTQVVGSSVTGDSIAIVAGRDATLQGSQIIAQHDVTLNAGRDLNIVTAQETSQTRYAVAEKKSGFSANLLEGVSYGNSAQDQQQNGTSTQQIGSSISGANVNMVSGRDTTIAASAITADQDVGIYAGRNVNVLAAANTDTSATASHNSGTSFGIQGGLNGRFTNFSNTSAAQTGSGNATTQSTSLISANAGNLNLQAGLDNHYKGTGQGNVITQGAELLAKNNITLAGNAVDLQAVHNATASKTHAETHSVTLGSSLTGNIGGAITRIGDQVTEAQHTDNDRLKGALALKSGYDAYKLVSGGQISSTTAESLKPNPQNKSGGGFGVSVSLGTSQSKQDSSNSATQARGTTLQANNIAITAREGDITMEGAKLQAQNIALDAAKNINLLAAKNTATLQSSNSGSNAGIGATLGSNGEQTGLSFQLGASLSKGHANGSETTYDNTQITATDHLTMKSGGDTNLIGAQLAADKVKATIGGNLNIVTLQDQNNYDSKQENGGFSVSLCIPPICAGVSTGSVNYAKQTVEHNYHSAVGQSGIAAGSGGFDINVKGNTDLQGGAITSTAETDKNTLHTASLTSRDLINQQHTASDSLSAGFSSGGLMSNIAANVLGNLNGGAGMPKDNDETSQTKSVISPATVTITGTGDAETDAQSQANADTLTERDASTANATLANTLTLQQAQELQAQQKKAQENQRAADLAGAALNGMVGDIAKSFKFAEGSPQKIAMHGIVGLIQAKLGDTSIAGGMIAGMVVEKMSPIISDYLLNNGYDTSTEAGLQAYNDMMGLGATLIGAASGALAGGGKESAGAGGMIGKNADTNNRSLHPDEKTLAKRLAANSDGKYTVEQVEEQMRGMSMTKDGQTEGASPDTIIGTNLGDGTWMRVGTTAEGEPIFTQQIAPDDAALRAYIVGNTNNNVVPSLITYAGNSEYTAPVTRNILPIPTAHCGAAAADCAAGIAPPRTQAERDAQRNQGADLASDISTQAGRFAAAATAYGTFLASQPNAAA
ncbi:hemagglutinin repeat-containing protein [Glaciimonas sp. CA11.2]|uniref:hemagglutinin repeat-containing protein n=1 Tax=Glaciimonas sp. CA11.2 TaxID=3048601 RepID=UPI002AB4A3C7|nr:hemagglutinin repeat-containing protein [Glaciimonas sp. CA11.2]MDY7546028.1 hemagglutinin repeat-containing protein [Glaciimonas sp. CA11.2]MEB0162564.1 hemagglutinin repeat-containing protein [Glaciimonas sp. CA11.2]